MQSVARTPRWGGSDGLKGVVGEKIVQTGLTYRRGLAQPWGSSNRIPPVHQRSIIAGLSTLSLTGEGRFGMITTGTGTTITMPSRAGRV